MGGWTCRVCGHTEPGTKVWHPMVGGLLECPRCSVLFHDPEKFNAAAGDAGEGNVAAPGVESA